MTSLPYWITSRMIELFGELFQELLTHQSYGIITFSNGGIVGFDNE